MKTLKVLFVILIIALGFEGCRYNFIVPEEVPPVVDPGDPDAPQMSFKTDIAPIFNVGDKCTACHTTGKTAPDLTTDRAYASLNTTKYINSAIPEESRIYKHPHPDTNEHVGGGKKKYTAQEAANVLLWIQQGAKNN